MRCKAHRARSFFQQLHGCGTCDGLPPRSADAPPACGRPAPPGTAGNGPDNPYRELGKFGGTASLSFAPMAPRLCVTLAQPQKKEAFHQSSWPCGGRGL